MDETTDENALADNSASDSDKKWRNIRKEKRKAADWYRWLWLSPLVTVFTAIFLYSLIYDPVFDLVCPDGYRNCDWDIAERIPILIALVGSALWHLILLIPALDKEKAFVCWHGRQALLLAGVRTAVPLAMIILVNIYGGLLAAILVLIPIWFAGTLWGQRQAKRGDCSLARWLGKADVLPPPEPSIKEASVKVLINTLRENPEKGQCNKAVQELRERGLTAKAWYWYPTPHIHAGDADPRIQTLLDVFRHNPEKRERDKALGELQQLGLVEPF